ncbi:protein-S-isoprenylcysteine O-methyltransferase [Favolaschia claudopus]|uniref:Protein-S-isoprenylcysteine O-methyltransferase n=1 Tax=Favolaschia claudopus TaxID=2862362 RepID=A0AAW0DWB3_9AGAR
MLIKIPCILYAMAAFQIAATPPNPPPSANEQLASTFVEVLLRQRSGLLLLKCVGWVIALLEVTVITVSHLPDWPWSREIMSALVLNGRTDCIYMSPLFVIGVILTLAGASIRYRCYCELGNLFTFEVSIRDDHKLVQTGLYSRVRHPGYLGVLLTVLGVFCWTACPGSWLRECGALDTTTGLFIVGLCGGLLIFISVGLLMRMSSEDKALEQHFGDDWVQWSIEVPYKLIPGVF